MNNNSSNNIFHYTSADALMGILEGNFWATEINFLNDYKELHIGMDAISSLETEWNQIINDFESSNKDMEDEHRHRELVKNYRFVISSLIKEANEYIADNKICVVSFSKDTDYTRQWMTYCPENQGYCIEFDRNVLSDNFIHHGSINICDIDYQDGDQLRHEDGRYDNIRNLLNCVIGDISEIDLKADQFNEIIEKYTGHILVGLLNIVPSIKPLCFKDENEVRLIKMQYNEDLEFRSRNGVLIPYTTVDFPKAAIKEVIIGPSNNQELLIKGLEAYKKVKQHSFEIVKSNSTLRVF